MTETGLPTSSAQVLQSQGIVPSDVANFLNALEVEEVLYNQLEYTTGIFGEYFGSLVIEFTDTRKKEPPQAFIFVVADIGTDDEQLAPVPNYGFWDYDGLYGGFLCSDYTDAATSRSAVNAVSQVNSLGTGDPINILALVLRDKATRQSAYNYNP